jgi:hypothetical protein
MYGMPSAFKRPVKRRKTFPSVSGMQEALPNLRVYLCLGQLRMERSQAGFLEPARRPVQAECSPQSLLGCHGAEGCLLRSVAVVRCHWARFSTAGGRDRFAKSCASPVAQLPQITSYHIALTIAGTVRRRPGLDEAGAVPRQDRPRDAATRRAGALPPRGLPGQSPEPRRPDHTHDVCAGHSPSPQGGVWLIPSQPLSQYTQRRAVNRKKPMRNCPRPPPA